MVMKITLLLTTSQNPSRTSIEGLSHKTSSHYISPAFILTSCWSLQQGPANSSTLPPAAPCYPAGSQAGAGGCWYTPQIWARGWPEWSWCLATGPIWSPAPYSAALGIGPETQQAKKMLAAAKRLHLMEPDSWWAKVTGTGSTDVRGMTAHCGRRIDSPSQFSLWKQGKRKLSHPDVTLPDPQLVQVGTAAQKPMQLCWFASAEISEQNLRQCHKIIEKEGWKEVI